MDLKFSSPGVLHTISSRTTVSYREEIRNAYFRILLCSWRKLSDIRNSGVQAKYRITMTYAGYLLFLLVVSYSSYAQCKKCVPAENVTCPDACICDLCYSPMYIMNPSLTLDCASKQRLTKVPSKIPTATVYLDLSTNKIGRLGALEFAHLAKLNTLNLAHNLLDGNQMHPDVFEGLENLEYLLLRFNRAITTVRSEWFRPLHNLWKIDLRESSVEIISEDAFRYNVKLCFLLLYGNQIKKLEPATFRNLPSLEKVFLETNQVEYLPPDMFNGSAELDELNLANNKITTISPTTGLQHLENLKRLYVHHNPLDCGCDLVWFRKWIDTGDVIVKPQNTTCASGLNLMKFNPDGLQCEFPVVLVSVLASVGVILLCAVIALLVTNRWRIRYRLYLLKLLCKGYLPINDKEELMGEYKYDIFISHSRKDENWVLNVLRPTLENPPYNYKLCLDFRDFIVGSCISENIIDAINESRKTAFVVTNEFIESEWCYFELEMVRQKMFEEHRDIAILILKEDVPANRMPGLLQYLMRRGNHIEWSDNRQGQKLFWKKMENSVKQTAINMA
ncbi:toll-like receptor 13 [Ptychodera flava]|uniref:toll-like receptor 13 n=1 Tax=Ptychodera flava TaxID=63121 RepID=UPI00396A220C